MKIADHFPYSFFPLTKSEREGLQAGGMIRVLDIPEELVDRLLPSVQPLTKELLPEEKTSIKARAIPKMEVVTDLHLDRIETVFSNHRAVLISTFRQVGQEKPFLVQETRFEARRAVFTSTLYRNTESKETYLICDEEKPVTDYFRDMLLTMLKKDIGTFKKYMGTDFKGETAEELRNAVTSASEEDLGKIRVCNDFVNSLFRKEWNEQCVQRTCFSFHALGAALDKTRCLEGLLNQARPNFFK